MEQPTNDLMARFELDYVRPVPGRTLVVGSKIYPGREDRRLRYSDAMGVDMLEGDGVDVVHNLENGPFITGATVFSHVDCVSVLEHSMRPWKMAETIQTMMHPGASIYINVPFIWRVHAYPDDYFRFTAAGVRVLFDEIEWEVIKYVSNDISDSHKLRAMVHSETGVPYLPRTSILAFGHKHYA